MCIIVTIKNVVVGIKVNDIEPILYKKFFY